MSLGGDVEGQAIVLIDDICDTADTLSRASNVIMENGAQSEHAVCKHAVLSGNAYETIENSALSEMIVTDTIHLDPGKAAESTKIRVLSTAKLFADSIKSINEHGSISALFTIEQQKQEGLLMNNLLCHNLHLLQTSI